MSAGAVIDRPYRAWFEPVECVWPQSQKVWRIANRRELRPAEQFNRRSSLECRQIQTSVLNEAGEVCDDQNDFVLVSANKRENSMVFRIQKLQRAASECFISFPHGNKPLHPPQHRMGVVLLRLHIERFVV